MHRGGRAASGSFGGEGVEAPLHHRAKWRIEAALRDAALPCAWSILRQPTYLENFANDTTAASGTALRVLRPGVVSGLLAPEEELTVIAVRDLAAVALAVLRRGPDEYGGRVIAAGGARISGTSLAAAASRVHGRSRFAYRQVPWWVLRFLIPVDYPRQLARWLSKGGNDEGATAAAATALLAESRALHPDMLSVEEWLERQGVADLPPPWWQTAEQSMTYYLRRLKSVAPEVVRIPIS